MSRNLWSTPMTEESNSSTRIARISSPRPLGSSPRSSPRRNLWLLGRSRSFTVSWIISLGIWTSLIWRPLKGSPGCFRTSIGLPISCQSTFKSSTILLSSLRSTGRASRKDSSSNLPKICLTRIPTDSRSLLSFILLESSDLPSRWSKGF